MTDPYYPRPRPAPQHAGAQPAGQTTAGAETGAGTVVGGRYVLRVAVGHGGMGTVWRATDNQLGRSVAVKEVVPPAGIARDDRDAMYERMMREARAAAGLSHPGIVQVYDVVTDAGRPWVVMELLDARSLSDLVLQDGPLAPRAVAKIGVALLGALEVAHAAGVLHRDVKPANVLVCTDGRCVLTDFGVARMPSDQQLTTPGMVLGSPHFISPERAMGAPFGPPSDLFSVGVTLYVAVEGRPPFDKGEPIATMHSVVEDEPPPPQRAGPLTDVLYGLLDKDPARRWDAAAARTALRDLLAGPLMSATPQFPTDPYSVVPAQRLPWQPEPAERPGKVGGRALLAPGHGPAVLAGSGAAGLAAHGDQTVVFERAGVGAPDPYAAVADPYQQTPDSYSPGLAEPEPVPGAGELVDPDRPASRPLARSEQLPRSGGASALAGQAKLLAGRAGTAISEAGAGLGRAGARGVAAARRAPRPVQVAAAVAAAAVMLSTGWLIASGGDDDPADLAGGEVPAPAPSAEPPEDGPLLEDVREYSGRGMVVNLPGGWEGLDNPDLVYVDFVDPADAASAQIRLIAEPWGGEPTGLVEFAEGSIQESSNCADPYQRLSLSDFEVAQQPAALLEYTCGEGEQMRQAKWATVVHDGTAYSFRFSALADDFPDRQVIFDELVRSFRLAG